MSGQAGLPSLRALFDVCSCNTHRSPNSSHVRPRDSVSHARQSVDSTWWYGWRAGRRSCTSLLGWEVGFVVHE